MDRLKIDAEGQPWRTVVEHLNARISEYTQRCISVKTPAEQKQEFAIRIDELRSLIDSPKLSQAPMHRATTVNGSY